MPPDASVTPTAAAAQADLLVLTPYLLASGSGKNRKAVNLGDGFILRAIERLLGLRFAPECLVSPRTAFTDQARELVAASRGVLIAGANQLNDNYTIVPGFDLEQLRALPAPFVPFALGLHGLPAYSRGMSDATRRLLREVHGRIRFSSWRCPITIEYLAREMPEIRDQLLMTGCVVIYDRPLLDGAPFREAVDSIAVTATERDAFWERETATLQAVAKQFSRASRFFVVHQDQVGPWTWRDALASRVVPRRDKRSTAQRLRSYAQSLGYEVVVPPDADTAIDFYRQVDMHFGSRLHAHLLFLSQAKRSFLTYVDDRALGMARAYDFPLCKPERLMEHLDLDFEKVRAAARRHHATMLRFISSMRADLGLTVG